MVPTGGATPAHAANGAKTDHSTDRSTGRSADPADRSTDRSTELPLPRKDSSEGWGLCHEFEMACAMEHQPRTLDGTVDAVGGTVTVGGTAEGRMEGAVHVHGDEADVHALSSAGLLVMPQYDPLEVSTAMSSSVESENTCSTGLSTSPTEGEGGERGALPLPSSLPLPSGGGIGDDPYSKSRPTSVQSLDDEWGWHVEFS
uniref:Uncharacterized protein n=1 Tax=Florenciella parvula TaxID=236787 RepID=A0A7S2BPC5_9STRA